MQRGKCIHIYSIIHKVIHKLDTQRALDPSGAKYVPVIENIAKEKSIKFKSIHLQSKEDAQNAPTPITTYALFLDGSYITNEQMNDKRFLKLLEK